MKEVISIACSESTHDHEKFLGELVSERSNCTLPSLYENVWFLEVLPLFWTFFVVCYICPMLQLGSHFCFHAQVDPLEITNLSHLGNTAWCCICLNDFYSTQDLQLG
jgi:cytochrome c biogenesis protein ResB